MERELESIADPFEETVLREVEEGSLDQQKRDEAWAMLADFVHDPSFSCGAPEGSLSEASWSAMVSPIRRCTGY